MQGRKVEDTIRMIINTKDLSLECAKLFRENILVPTLVYSTEIVG